MQSWAVASKSLGSLKAATDSSTETISEVNRIISQLSSPDAAGLGAGHQEIVSETYAELTNRLKDVKATAETEMKKVTFFPPSIVQRQPLIHLPGQSRELSNPYKS